MKRVLFVLFLMCLSGFTLLAGGAQGDSRQGADTVYSIMVPLTTPEAPTRETSVWAALERVANARFDIQWIAGDYNNRVNVSLAAGELPHVFVVTDPKSGMFINAARSGMFWELSDAINNSRNISRNLDPVVTRNLSTEGRSYILPRGRMMVRYGFVYRKDWADNLGIAPPTNLDEIYQMLRAFATQDPERSGRQVYGLATARSSQGAQGEFIQGITVPVAMNGGGMGWVEEGGNLLPTFMTSQYFEVMNWYKRLYDERIVNQDFAAITGNASYELCNAEQAGAWFHTTDKILNRVSPLLGTLQLRNPNLTLEDVWTFVTDVRSPGGSIRLPADAGHWGGMVFPRSRLRTQAEFQRVFDIFDAFESEDGKNLMNWGIENVNHTIDNNRAVVINESIFNRDVEGFRMGLSVTAVSVPGTLPGLKDPMQDRIETSQAFNARYAVPDLTYPLISQTRATRGAELDRIIGDAIIMYIMGEINEAGYMAVIEQWKRSGGQEVINEFTEGWRASQ